MLKSAHEQNLGESRRILRCGFALSQSSPLPLAAQFRRTAELHKRVQEGWRIIRTRTRACAQTVFDVTLHRWLILSSRRIDRLYFFNFIFRCLLPLYRNAFPLHGLIWHGCLANLSVISSSCFVGYLWERSCQLRTMRTHSCTHVLLIFAFFLHLWVSGLLINHKTLPRGLKAESPKCRQYH